jgi:hypothetical protein
MGFALIAGLILTISIETQAKEIPYRENQDSGSFVDSTIDTNSDGATAVFGQSNGKSTLGPMAHHFVSESAALPLAVNISCPEGTLEFPLVRARSIRRFATGDMFFTESVSGASCVDPTAGTFTSHVRVNITGGTGRFAEATGSLDLKATGTFLVIDPAFRLFAAFAGEGSGTIILPHK